MLPFLLFLMSADTLNLTLDQSVQLALRHSPTVADARLDTVDGQSKVWQGWSAVMPNLNGSVSRGWVNSKSRTDSTRRTTSGSWGASVGASQVLFDASTFSAVYQGYLGRDVSNLQSLSKMTQLIWSIRTDYYALQQAYGLLDIARLSVKNARDNYTLADVKQKLGKATGIEVLRADVNVRQSQLNQMSAEKALLTASEAFKADLGIDDPAVVKPEPVDTVLPTSVYNSFDDYWGAVVKANPTLQLAAKSEQTAALAKKVSYLKMLPSLTFSVSEHWGDSVLPSKSSPWGDNDALSFGFNLGFPILNVPDIVLGIHSANIALERAKIASRSSEIQMRQSAITAWLNYNQSMQQVGYAEQNVQLNQQLYRQAEQQYRLGQLTQLDLFTVETGLSQARVSYLSALADVRTLQAQLEYLSGK
jgi:outer membrane protein TolC